MDINRDKIAVDWIVGNKLRHTLIDIFLILACLAIVFCSIAGVFGSPIAGWFSRSGSVLVLVGAILEYRCNRFSQTAIEDSIRWASGIGGPTVFIPAWHRNLIKYIAHSFVVFGTLIWGYGDLWFNNI